MAKIEDEARLEQTKMSFGQHLEELRRALVKSIIALVLGFVAGLWLSNDIASYIQTPVLRSLKKFYLNQAETKSRAYVEALEAAGKDAPEGQIVTAEELAREGLMPMDFLVSPEYLRRLVAEHMPDDPAAEPASEKPPATDDRPLADAKQLKRGELDRDEMVTLRLYQPIEEDARLRVVAHSTTEPFAIYIRTAVIAGLVFASPFIFYFVWEFVAAGLYRQEQSYVYTYLPVSLGLFVGGATMAIFFAFEPLLEFMFWYFDRMGIQPDLQLSDWISFVMLMPLAFGVSFQLPLVMLLLERIGIFSVDTYWRKWRAAVVIIAIIAMLLTPSADPYSMLLMGIPLVGLYFGGIAMCRYMPGSPARRLRYGSASGV